MGGKAKVNVSLTRKQKTSSRKMPQDVATFCCWQRDTTRRASLWLWLRLGLGFCVTSHSNDNIGTYNNNNSSRSARNNNSNNNNNNNFCGYYQDYNGNSKGNSRPATPTHSTVDTRVCVGVCVLGGRQTFIVCLELVTLRQGQQREREGKWREKE